MLDLTNEIHSGLLTDVAKVVTELGAFPTCLGVVLVTSAVLASRRRFSEMLVLLAGFALIYLTVEVTKSAIDRPRPDAPLIDTQGSAFPSGHAAYATAWIACALMFTRRLHVVSAAVVTGAVAIAAAVGLARIYLHAHLWSDVAGGWGLGVGVFGMLAVVAIVVDYMRHNLAAR
jgi:membrane-associated phospholipid phosphatase